MNQSKRNFLKVLPVAALTPAAVMLGESKAAAYEIKPNKKYIFVVPDITEHNAQQCRSLLSERGIDATVVSGVDDLKIYELDGND